VIRSSARANSWVDLSSAPGIQDEGLFTGYALAAALGLLQNVALNVVAVVRARVFAGELRPGGPDVPGRIGRWRIGEKHREGLAGSVLLKIEAGVGGHRSLIYSRPSKRLLKKASLGIDRSSIAYYDVGHARRRS
jgi:hypothetical protein